MANKERGESEAGVASVTRPRVQKGFLLLIVTGITILFLVMIRRFVVAVILAGVFAVMSRRAFVGLAGILKGRRRTAAMLTVMGLLLVIVVPLGAFLALVVAQAVDIGDSAGPWIREQAGRWEELRARASGLPLVGELVPDEGAIATQVGDAVGLLGSFLINNVGAATAGTLNLFLQLFIMLYAMYFFLLDGPGILSRALHYTPLEERDERRLISQFVSVTRATIKGSILVGLLQGALAGAAFFVLGIPAAAFWATVMAVLSVIPVLGSGLVWVPAAVILMSTERMAAGIALALWGLLIVGTVDNFLRPRLVGRDTKMHDVLVLLSTFGGLAMFGVVGFIVGPVVAALFLTAWDLYGAAFGDLLTEDDVAEDAVITPP